MSEDGPYYCAKCFAVVEITGEESYCGKCDADLSGVGDTLTHSQWSARSHADRVAWSDAERDGLIGAKPDAQGAGT